jgi:hypothetical protein
MRYTRISYDGTEAEDNQYLYQESHR